MMHSEFVNLQRRRKLLVCALALTAVDALPGCAVTPSGSDVMEERGRRVALDESSVRASLSSGLWTAINRTSGGLGESLAFGPGDELRQWFGALLDEDYVVVDDTLEVRSRDGVLRRYRAEFLSSDALRLTPVDGGPPLLLHRRSTAGATLAAKPVVFGVWRVESGMAVDAEMQFAHFGRLQTRIPLAAAKGTFSLDDRTLTVRMRSRDPQEISFTLSGDQLVLTSTSGPLAGKAKSYQRW